MDSTDEVLFTATTTHVNHIYRVIKAISVAGKEASITISDQGLKVSVENSSKSCQAHLFLNKQLFSLYNFKPEAEQNDANETDSSLVATFNVSLPALTGCLQIFSDPPEKNNSFSTSSGYTQPQTRKSRDEITVNNQCLFVYRGQGYPFMIYFTQGSNASITTKCELETYARNDNTNDDDDDDDSDEDNDPFANSIAIDPNSVVQKVILKGNLMEEALKELDAIDTQIVSIRASAKIAPHFTFISYSELGVSEYTFPNERSILEVFIVAPPGRIYDDLDSLIKEQNNDSDPTNWIVQNSYSFPTINLIRDTVFLAHRINIRCDSAGIMSIQSLCETDPECQSYIDFRFLPTDN